MRPVFPSLAALAWGEPRRRTYWEQELINALRIVERGWSTPAEMRGSWAGAMGHTQWMPEVWLNIGMDYDGDGRVNPFGRPDDALASSARYLINRGKYRRGEHWGYEVRAGGQRGGDASKSYEAWQKAGVTRADGKPFPSPKATAKLWVPVPGGPAFLLGPNFYAVRSYNPSMNYTLAIVHLADVIKGGELRRPEIPRRRAAADAGRDPGNPAPSHRAWLRHQGRRRPRRRRHHAGGLQFPAQGRHGAGRLCRRAAAGTVARSPLIRFYPAHLRLQANQTKDCPVTTATARAVPAAEITTDAHPSLKEIDRPANLTTANAPGWGSRRGRRRAARPQDSLYRAQSGRELSRHPQFHRQLSRQRDAADAALPARGGRGLHRPRLRQGHRQGHGGSGALQRRPVPRHDGGVQRLVRPFAGADPRRNRPGRRPQAASLDRLDPHRARSGRHRSRLHQVGRPAGLAGRLARGHAARRLDRQHRADGPGLHQFRCRTAGGEARGAAAADRSGALHAAGGRCPLG